MRRELLVVRVSLLLAALGGCAGPSAGDGGAALWSDPIGPTPGDVGAAVARTYRALPEYRLILEADRFEGIAVGAGGEVPFVVFALQTILASAEADAAFKELLEGATVPGKLYALCGLYFTDRDAFRAGAEALEDDPTEIDAALYGCTAETVRVRDVVAERPTAPGTETGEDAGEDAGEDDGCSIADGCWPKAFRDARPADWTSPQAVKDLAGRLWAESLDARLDAATTLAAWGPWARDALPELSRKLADGSEGEEKVGVRGEEVLEAVADALTYLGPPAIAALEGGATSPDPGVRGRSVEGLVGIAIGWRSDGARRTIERLAAGASAETSEEAKGALERIREIEEEILRRGRPSGE
jgi:hypothetical protein